MAVLVVVLAVLVVSCASSMRAYLQQRAHINDLNARIDSSERDIKALEREKRRWQTTRTSRPRRASASAG